jgi:hypothetical protein
MSTAPLPPSFDVTQEQGTRLVSYIQAYRRYAWEYQAPSVPRNEMIRAVQSVQGKLMSGMDQPYASFALQLTGEELAAIHRMVQELLIIHGMQPANQDRNGILADLATLRAYLARTLTFR